MTRFRITDILILILGLAVMVDTSVQLSRDDGDVVWQPIAEEAPCCEAQAIEDLNPVFIA